MAYVKLDPSEAFPRLKVVYRTGLGGRLLHLGPFSASSAARLAKEAIEEIVPLRRCTRAMGARTRFAPCALADIGRCPAPCDGRVGPEHYGELVRDLLSSSGPRTGSSERSRRMATLAEAERFEEAAGPRPAPCALAGVLHRERQDRWLLGAGRLEVVAEGTRAPRSWGRARAGGRRRGADPLPARASAPTSSRRSVPGWRTTRCDWSRDAPWPNRSTAAPASPGLCWSRDPERTRSRRR